MRQQQFGRCALVLSLAVAGVAMADMNDNVQSGTMAVLKDDLSSPGTVRASKLMDAEVYDTAGKGVGKIKDIVLDRDYNTIDYTVISRGTPGINEKLLAMPYKALSYGGPLDKRVYVQVPQDILAKAPGFDQAKWPTEPDLSYYRSLDTYYDTRLSTMVRPDNPADNAVKASASLDAPADLSWSRRATKLIGRDVLSPTGEKLGDIKDLVIDTKTGDVRYAVLAQTGAWGKPRYYAVPLNQFRTITDDKKLTLNISAADLKASPSFDVDHWPASADPRWTTVKIDVAK